VVLHGEDTVLYRMCAQWRNLMKIREGEERIRILVVGTTGGRAAGLAYLCNPAGYQVHGKFPSCEENGDTLRLKYITYPYDYGYMDQQDAEWNAHFGYRPPPQPQAESSTRRSAQSAQQQPAYTSTHRSQGSSSHQQQHYSSNQGYDLASGFSSLHVGSASRSTGGGGGYHSSRTDPRAASNPNDGLVWDPRTRQWYRP
jgi:hypothetical protein